MLPIYNWRKTRAFSLPTDQYGWIRINLEGREAEGSVPLARYKEIRDDLESMLRLLKDHNGELLVREVVQTVTNGAETLHHRIPDLVVHWNDAAFTPNLRIENTDFEARPVGIKTGQHALDGFCVIKGGPHIDLGTSILAEEMGSLITKMLVSP